MFESRGAFALKGRGIRTAPTDPVRRNSRKVIVGMPGCEPGMELFGATAQRVQWLTHNAPPKGFLPRTAIGGAATIPAATMCAFTTSRTATLGERPEPRVDLCVDV